MLLLNAFLKIVENGNIANLVQGCGYHFLSKNITNISSELEMLGQHRLEICEDCEIRDKSYCSSEKKGKAIMDFKYGTELRFKDIEYQGCSCYLHCKTLVSAEICPLGKWLNTT